MRIALIAALLAASPVMAQVEQDILRELQEEFGGGVDAVPERGEVNSELRNGAMLRGLDKMTGRAVDVPVMAGDVVQYERLDIRLEACRSPAEGEVPDAYAFVTVQDRRYDEPQFSGWMIATSPALNAMDHPRYDLWVASCIDEMPSGFEAPIDAPADLESTLSTLPGEEPIDGEAPTEEGAGDATEGDGTDAGDAVEGDDLDDAPLDEGATQ
ncbi:DUF2155 domain-containing protein [Roseobacter sp. HKCCA0434]|uniref:DUF2155 domain-containing protein n=1 Tax=Roseobacter sp. HKCCA0434 TaxID=3079297 RepID=UPI002905A914|nr:DUF2155 domain-containing protein [Roseobacter sp. HKCCA0434]